MIVKNWALMAISLAIVTQSGCGAGNALKQADSASAVTSCYFMLDHEKIAWRQVLPLEKAGLEEKVGNTALPASFTVYQIDTAALGRFLISAKQGGGVIRLPSPTNGRCLEFDLTESGAMDPALAARFPELVSLKGMSRNSGAQLRLDYDGRKMQAEIVENGVVYFIMPWPGSGGIYYLVYQKDDSSVPKKDFELR